MNKQVILMIFGLGISALFFQNFTNITETPISDTAITETPINQLDNNLSNSVTEKPISIEGGNFKKEDTKISLLDEEITQIPHPEEQKVKLTIKLKKVKRATASK